MLRSASGPLHARNAYVSVPYSGMLLGDYLRLFLSNEGVSLGFRKGSSINLFGYRKTIGHLLSGSAFGATWGNSARAVGSCEIDYFAIAKG
jgi:hypothetical protein